MNEIQDKYIGYHYYYYTKNEEFNEINKVKCHSYKSIRATKYNVIAVNNNVSIYANGH